MKKIIVLFFVLLVGQTAFPQGILKMIGHSEDLFKLLSEDKFKEAYDYFDTSFQAKVSEEKVKEIWTELTTKMGPLQDLAVLSSKTQGEFFTVILEGKFANDMQNFLIAFNKSEKIVGFFLQPTAKPEAYKVPAYADTSLYREKEVYVKAGKHELAGMLTLPRKAGKYPLVVFVHGSGAHDMDETIGPNKPFKDLATGLASKGIASIRYVKRTLLYPNEFIGAITVKEEVLDDALAAIALARTVPEADKLQLYVLGHSLGGMLAPRIARAAPDLKGIILMAAPARNLMDISVEQRNYFFALGKDTTRAARLMLDSANMETNNVKLIKPGTIKPDSVLLGMPASYWADLNVYNQVATAKQQARQRIFVAQGGNDFQVSVTDFNLWKAALGTRKNVSLKLYPELNHLMMPQKEKADIRQYEVPSNVSVVLVNDLSSWIKTK